MTKRDAGPSKSDLRILMLEDMPTDAELCEHELRRGGFVFESQRVETRKGFERALEEFAPDLIISDFSLPSAFDGLSALAIARSKAPDTPFVFVSGTIGEERAVEAMKQGAADYVLKDHLRRLVPVVRRALQERSERIALRNAEEQRRRHEEKLAKLLRVRAVLGGINGAIVRIRDEQALYREACRIVVHEGGFKLATAATIDPDTLDATVCTVCGNDRGYAASLHLSASEESAKAGGLLGIAVRTGRLAVSNDAPHDERLLVPEAGIQLGYRSIAVLPLKPDAHVSAVLALFAEEKDFFDDEEVRLLEELAANLSFALSYMDKAARLDHLAYYDALTGLANRRLLRDRVKQLIARAAAEGSAVVLMAVDLQRFRSINESLGTAAGDAVLRQTAERLKRASGGLGTVARLAADRFAIALAEPDRQAEAVHLALERVRECLEPAFALAGESLRVQARIGVALYPADADKADTLLTNAEAALASAKRAGEPYIFYARQMNARVTEMLRLENELRVALRAEQFVLYYQPRVSLSTKALSGMEALIRWQHPQLGLVPPADFIPLLEESGLILEVGRWALTRAAADAVRWRALGLAPVPIGVNVSAIQLRQKDFVEQVTAAIQTADAAAHSIEIELTESMLMSHVEESVRKLNELRAAGIKVAIDDFGTGYSSLGYLVRLPVDALKVDRSFVSPMSTSPMHMAVVSTVISLAHGLDLRVVAEGVETEEQANLLRLLRCDEAQGFFYSRPLPFEQVAAAYPQRVEGAPGE